MFKTFLSYANPGHVNLIDDSGSDTAVWLYICCYTVPLRVIIKQPIGVLVSITHIGATW